MMKRLMDIYQPTTCASGGKGPEFRKSVRRHALRNSLIPVATSFGNNISLLIGGSLIETIFNIDGIGLLGYEAIIERDYPIVMGILVISSPFPNRRFFPISVWPLLTRAFAGGGSC